MAYNVLDGTVDYSTTQHTELLDAQANQEIKGTKVDGVYSDDPVTNPKAELYRKLGFKEVLNRELRVMDMTAVTLCKENNLPIGVFNIQNNNNLIELLRGNNIGTRIS